MKKLFTKTAQCHRLNLSRLALVCILMLAAALRLIHLTRRSMWLDEVFSIRFVSTRGFLQVIGDTFSIDYHPFSYYALLDVWLSVLGCSDLASRLLSVVMGVGAVFSVHLLAKNAFRDERAALLCAFLTAVSPTHIRYSQEVRMYVLLLLVWPLFLNYLYEAWRTGYSNRPCFALLLTFTVFTYAHGTAGFFALTVLTGSAGLFVNRSMLNGRRSDAVRAIAVVVSGVVLYLPWFYRLVSLRASNKQLGEFGIAKSVDLFQWMLFFREFLGTTQLVVVGLAVAGSFLALFRWQHLHRQVILPLVPLSASIAIPLVVQFLMDTIKANYQARNLVFLLPPTIACLSFLVVQLIDLSRDRLAVRFGRPLALVSVVIASAGFCMVMASGTLRLVESVHGKEQWREAVQAIGPHIERGDVVVFYASFMRQCWDHYAVGYNCMATDTAEEPAYEEMGIRRAEDKRIFMEDVRDVVRAARRMKGSENSVWVFYSHVMNAGRVHSLLKSSGLRQIGEWRGQGVRMIRYAK